MTKINLKNRIKKIKVLALDVDGVMTDGKIIFDSEGKETKNFDVQDGFALVLLKKAGFKTAIITARSSNVVSLRARDLNVDKTYQDAYPKVIAYEQMLKDFNVTDSDVCFMGDDLPDRQIIKRAGLGVAVANAAADVKRSAHYITKHCGGDGAIREVIELILKGQGKWKKILAADS